MNKHSEIERDIKPGCVRGCTVDSNEMLLKYLFMFCSLINLKTSLNILSCKVVVIKLFIILNISIIRKHEIYHNSTVNILGKAFFL